MGVDLFLAAEFHDDTTHTRGGMTPVQVVHGGPHLRASWLVIDEYQDQLQLTLMASRGSRWATNHLGALVQKTGCPVIRSPARRRSSER